MQELRTAWQALAFGGPMVYPLLLLGIIAMVIIIDRAALYARCLRLPQTLFDLVETYGFSWDDLERELKALPPVNAKKPRDTPCAPRVTRCPLSLLCGSIRPRARSAASSHVDIAPCEPSEDEMMPM